MSFEVKHIFSGVNSKHATHIEAVQYALELENGIVFDENEASLIVYRGKRFVPSLSDEAKVFRLLTVLEQISTTNAIAFGSPEMAFNMIKQIAANVVSKERAT